jgi:hypothetical protein
MEISSWCFTVVGALIAGMLFFHYGPDPVQRFFKSIMDFLKSLWG